MIDTETTPTRLLKTVAAVAKWSLWLMVSAWTVLAMVWGALHFLIVPRISELRPWVEQQATLTLGHPVRIAALSAQSNGLIPSVEISEVELFDAQGRVALRLPRVLVAVSPRSVLGGGLEQLYIDHPSLDVRRTPDGALWVAGLPLRNNPDADSVALDWLFSQSEIAIRGGTVTWTDELRAAPPLVLTDLDWVLRNRHHSHSMRLDATPAPALGERLSLSGSFKQPLLSRNPGHWQDWKGTLYSNFSAVDLAQLRRYMDVGAELTHGQGAVRAWVDIDQGVLGAATVDLALREVEVSAGKKLEPLAFKWIAGRLGARVVDGGYELSTQALEFDTQDGLHWPGGNLRLGLFSGSSGKEPHGELQADRLDLTAMAQIANRLPFNEGLHTLLSELEPKGTVQKLQGSWQGSAQRPSAFAVNGRIEQLEIAAQASGSGKRPGFKGLDVDFDVTQERGKAHFSMKDGTLEAPEFFDEPLLPFEHLLGDVQWKGERDQVSLSATNVRFGNADAQGEMQFKWHSANAASAAVASADQLGVLDLQGSLSRAQLKRVYRYLPLGIAKNARDYVRDAVVSGAGSAVKFKVKGNLRDFPFNDPRQGEFHISANLQDASYAYVPSALLAKDSLPWPLLTQLSAEFVMDRTTLQIRGAHANALGAEGLHLTHADSTVSNLTGAAQVSVSAQGRAPLGSMLAFVNQSPLGTMTNHVLARASASGTADFNFKLEVPLSAVERTTVQGGINLVNNDLQVMPDTPRLSRVRSAIAFSETGFSVTGTQAKALGGDIRIEGGLNTASGSTQAGAKAAPSVLRIQGSASAEGLRQAKELGPLARLAQRASGSAAYSVNLGLRGGVPELLVSTNLVGMALSLPPPFNKPAEVALPLRWETSVVRTPAGDAAVRAARVQEQLQLELGALAKVTYVRDISGPQAQVLRGAIAVGLAADESAPLPERGVVANINLGQIDLGAWSEVLSQATGSTAGTTTPVAPATNSADGMAYLPTSLVLRARELDFGGRKLKRVVLGGGRDGLLWRANMDATELNGYLEYRQSMGPTAGRLYARLARLVIEPSVAQDVEKLLDEQPASIPALDIVVEDFELRGKSLGRVDIEAVNQGSRGVGETAREWRLNRFDITTPEASLKAAGNWTDILMLEQPALGKDVQQRRRTAMKFTLDINDAGTLLERFGMPGVVRKGQGKIEGRVGWFGSPITLDYASMSGAMNINIEAGQFLKTEPGIAKLLGVLSLQSLPRRLALDFRDVFSEGFSFDFLRGDVTIEQGMARTNNLQMKGVNAAVLMEGQADIAKETQSIKVVVVPEINAGSASLIASTINPLIGLSTFLAQLILRKPLIDAATQEFLVDGTWVDPHVTKVEHGSAPAPARPPMISGEAK